MVKHHVPHTIGIADCIEKAKVAIRHHTTIMHCTEERDRQAYMNARRNLRLAEANLRAWEMARPGGAA
ncbi:MAG: hypothetical protein K9M17_05430 [Mariprofundaceae bacterium]|nr:hypothetical protein [Mariprofundaceae bacterium]